MFPMLSFDVVARHQLREVLQGWLVAMEACNHMTSAWPGLFLLYICSVAKLGEQFFYVLYLWRCCTSLLLPVSSSRSIWRSGAAHLVLSQKRLSSAELVVFGGTCVPL